MFVASPAVLPWPEAADSSRKWEYSGRERRVMVRWDCSAGIRELDPSGILRRGHANQHAQACRPFLFCADPVSPSVPAL
jgi:hypothetical protein